jgi:hypothetical protein
MNLLKALNLLLSFLLELAMLAALATFGITVGKNAFAVGILGLGLPLLAAVLWGIFAAPKSRHRLPQVPRLLFALLMFGLSDTALYSAGRTAWALDLAVIGLMNLILAYTWKQ